MQSFFQEIKEWIISLFTPVVIEQPIIITHPIKPMNTSLTAIITRISDNGTETLGELNAINGTDTFKCETLELPWKDNQSNISCIPKGTYPCTLQPFHAEERYELSGTGKRFAIFIHEGNEYTDVLGCILLGVHPSDINGDGQIDVTNSRTTIANFIAFFQGRPFTLIIQ